MGIPPILMYHRIGHRPGDGNTVSPERFELQLQYLEDHGFTSLGLTEWHHLVHSGQTVPSKAVILTFDDGYRDNWELAAPLLARYGAKATVFMVAEGIGRKNSWESVDSRRDAELMNGEDLRDWIRQGFEVGSHGMSHARVTELSEEKLRYELVESKKTLEDIVGVEVPFFCYPHGNFDEVAKSAIQEAGYLGAVAIVEGTRWDQIDWYALPRLRVSDRDEPGIFRWKVSALHSWMGRARQWEKNVKKIIKK